MSQSLRIVLPAADPAPADTAPGESSEDQALRETLKRCSPETLEAARAFRRTGELVHVRPIILGIIERFVERDLRPRLQGASSDLRLVEDLGLDSLSLMEVVIVTEEALRVTIDNEELRNLRTLGDIHHFVDQKLRGIPSSRSLEVGGAAWGDSPAQS